MFFKQRNICRPIYVYMWDPDIDVIAQNLVLHKQAENGVKP